MTRSPYGILAASTLVLAGLVASAPSARADYFEFTSTISIDTTVGSYTPAGSVIVNAPGGASGSLTTPNGNQLILNALSSNQNLPRNNGSGQGTDITPMNLNANSAFPTDMIGLHFILTLTLTDYEGPLDLVPQGGTNPVSFVFNGTIGGQLGNFQSNLNLLTFVPAQVTEQVGNSIYTITLNNFSSPGTDSDGRLSLHVTARSVPEPGSIALVGIGGVGVFGLFLRRRVKASV